METTTTSAVQPMTDMQQYMFDVQGYLVVRNALSEAEVSELTALVEDNIGPEVGDGAITAMDDGSVRLVNFLAWGEPVRRLLDHPAVTGILNHVLNPGFRLDHYYGMRQPKGTGLLPLHGGGSRPGTDFYTTTLGGRPYSGLTVVSWALTDSPPDGGGFLCIPGSHKANFELPRFLDWFYKKELMDFPDDPDFVRRVRVNAGDVIIFTEALCHAADTWPLEEPRLALLYKYCPAPLTWGEYQAPDPALLELLTPAQRRLFLPPYVFPGREPVGLPGAGRS